MSFRHCVTLSFVMSGLAGTLAQAAPQLLYGNNADGGLVKSLDLGTQAARTYSLSSANQITGLAADDAAQRLYVAFGDGGTAGSPTNNLYTFDYNGTLLASTRTFLNGGTNGNGFTGLTYANGTLYGIRGQGTGGRQSGIYSIDPATGSSSLFIALSDSAAVPASFNVGGLDLDYDAANGRFVVVATAVFTPNTPRGIYAVTLPTAPGGTSITKLADPPAAADQPGTNQPDGLAINGNIAYLTYNRSNLISRFDLSSNTYLSNLTGPNQGTGASGDATFATGFVPEPALLMLLPTAAVVALRRRK